MDLEKKINFDGGHGRKGIIKFNTQIKQCDVCNTEDAIGLYTDASEHEYAGASICNECLSTEVKNL